MPITASARSSRERTGAATPQAPSLVSSRLDAQPRSRIAASLGAECVGISDCARRDLGERTGEHPLEHVCPEEGEQRLGGRTRVQRHDRADLERQPQGLRRLDPVDTQHRPAGAARARTGVRSRGWSPPHARAGCANRGEDRIRRGAETE